MYPYFGDEGKLSFLSIKGDPSIFDTFALENVRFSFMLVVLKHITIEVALFIEYLDAEILPVVIFLQHVLALWKREILLMDGSKTTSSRKLGTLGLLHVNGNALRTKREKWEINCRDNTRQQLGNLSLFPHQNFQGKMLQQLAMCSRW